MSKQDIYDLMSRMFRTCLYTKDFQHDYYMDVYNVYWALYGSNLDCDKEYKNQYNSIQKELRDIISNSLDSYDTLIQNKSKILELLDKRNELILVLKCRYTIDNSIAEMLYGDCKVLLKLLKED